MKKNIDIGCYDYLTSIEQIIEASNELVRMINEFEEQASNLPELISYYNKTKEDISHFRENFIMKTSVSAQVDTKLKAILKRRRAIKDAHNIYFETGLDKTILAARDSLEDSCFTYDKIKKTIDNKKYMVRTESGAEILEFLISSGARMIYPVTANKDEPDLENYTGDSEGIFYSDNNNSNSNQNLNSATNHGSDNNLNNDSRNTSNTFNLQDCYMDEAEQSDGSDVADDSEIATNKNNTMTTIKRNKEKSEWELYRKKQLLASSKKLDDIFLFLAKGNYCKRPNGLPKDVEKVFDERLQKAAESIVT